MSFHSYETPPRGRWAAALAVAVALAGCGGSSASAPAAPSADRAAQHCVDSGGNDPSNVMLCLATSHVRIATQRRMTACLNAATGAGDVIACMRRNAG